MINPLLRLVPPSPSGTAEERAGRHGSRPGRRPRAEAPQPDSAAPLSACSLLLLCLAGVVAMDFLLCSRVRAGP